MTGCVFFHFKLFSHSLVRERDTKYKVGCTKSTRYEKYAMQKVRNTKIRKNAYVSLGGNKSFQMNLQYKLKSKVSTFWGLGSMIYGNI